MFALRFLWLWTLRTLQRCRAPHKGKVFSRCGKHAVLLYMSHSSHTALSRSAVLSCVLTSLVEVSFCCFLSYPETWVLLFPVHQQQCLGEPSKGRSIVLNASRAGFGLQSQHDRQNSLPPSLVWPQLRLPQQCQMCCSETALALANDREKSANL